MVVKLMRERALEGWKPISLFLCVCVIGNLGVRNVQCYVCVRVSIMIFIFK